MTVKDYQLLKKHEYSFYSGRMGEVFNDWHVKKIDTTEAIQKLKKWYNKGIEKIGDGNQAGIQKKELERCFDSLTSFIKDKDLVEEESSNNSLYHFFEILKDTAPETYNVIKKMLAINEAEIEAIHSTQTPEHKQPIQNKFVKEMIEEGILSKDGKIPLKKLDDVACFLVDKGQNLTVRVLQDLDLTKRDGKPYSSRAYGKAVNIANSTSRKNMQK